MVDARGIGVDGQARSARTVLAGADRASGERAKRRRRTTPLLRSEPSGPDLGPTPSDTIDAAAAPEVAAALDVTVPAETPATSPAKAPATGPVKTPAQTPVKQAAKQATEQAVERTAKRATKRALEKATERAVEKAATAPAPKKAATAKKSAVPVKKAAAKRGTPVAPVTSLPPPAAPLPPATRFTDIEEPLPVGGRHSIAMAIVTQAGQALLEAVISRANPAAIESKVESILAFARRRLTGDYELDEFGFDPEFAEKIPLALLKPLYKHYFRVEVRGIENIPAEGGALVVANHSGTLPLDAVMTAVAVHEAHPQKRFLRTLGADLLFQTPFLAGLARRSGATLASNPDAEKLLSAGHLVGVWPEGFKGIGKPFSERYKLQRFGRGGFVSAALRTGTPIIPCSIVGAEEIYPIIADIPSLARLLGLPYIPITPFFPLLGPLGAIPLPSKWLIEFGPPVPTNEYGKHVADDPMVVFDLTDQVRQSIQQTLYSLLVQRRSIFF